MSLIVCRLIEDNRATSARGHSEASYRKSSPFAAGEGLSQEQFAFEVKVHRTYISDLERGARNPTIEIVDKLARYLGVSAGELLD
jgi:DNA-binding XRE family transcriptional regulator